MGGGGVMAGGDEGGVAGAQGVGAGLPGGQLVIVLLRLQVVQVVEPDFAPLGFRHGAQGLLVEGGGGFRLAQGAQEPGGAELLDDVVGLLGGEVGGYLHGFGGVVALGELLGGVEGDEACALADDEGEVIVDGGVNVDLCGGAQEHVEGGAGEHGAVGGILDLGEEQGGDGGAGGRREAGEVEDALAGEVGGEDAHGVAGEGVVVLAEEVGGAQQGGGGGRGGLQQGFEAARVAGEELAQGVQHAHSVGGGLEEGAHLRPRGGVPAGGFVEGDGEPGEGLEGHGLRDFRGKLGQILTVVLLAEAVHRRKLRDNGRRQRQGAEQRHQSQGATGKTGCRRHGKLLRIIEWSESARTGRSQEKKMSSVTSIELACRSGCPPLYYVEDITILIVPKEI